MEPLPAGASAVRRIVPRRTTNPPLLDLGLRSFPRGRWEDARMQGRALAVHALRPTDEGGGDDVAAPWSRAGPARHGSSGRGRHDATASGAGECSRGRRRRRDPAGRKHASSASARTRGRGGDPRLLPCAFRAEPLHALPRLPVARAAGRRAGARLGLGRAGRAARLARGGRERARRCARQLRAPARPDCGRGRVRRRGRVPAARRRHAPRGAARRAGGPARDRAVRRRGAARQPEDARRLRGARLRADARARGR